MKKLPLGLTIFLAVLAVINGVVTQNTVPLTAAELQVNPALCTVTDGIYEVSKPAPETVHFYSQPFDVVPGGLYRFKMNACWFGEGGGCFPAGIDRLTTDYNPAGSEEPNILCARIVRVKDNQKEARLSVGRNESAKTIRFTEPTLIPACPIYKMIYREKSREPGLPACVDTPEASFLPLGSGERIDGTHYTFSTSDSSSGWTVFFAGEGGNFARTLDYSDAEFNTNHLCLEKGNSVIYRFDLRPIKNGSAPDEVEPIRFVSAEVSIDIKYLREGNCLVEMSADGRNWFSVGLADEEKVITGSAKELFASPIETLYLRCRADGTDSALVHIYDITLHAELDTDGFLGEGKTIYAERAACADADERFEVTPLYFERGNIYCRVTNQTGDTLTWPAFSYTAKADSEEPLTCRATVARVDSNHNPDNSKDSNTGNNSTDLAAGESALFAVDLSKHPAGKSSTEITCCFDREYCFRQKSTPYFVQDYTRPLNPEGSSPALDLSWCEADRKVPRSPWSVTHKDPEPIAIAAPRNDFESFQVVVRPQGDLANLWAESSDLTGPDGTVISKENIQVRWGYYHLVNQPTDETCARGWYVDALVPISVGRSGEIGAPLPVTAGENQPIFVTVYVPLGIGKGDYTGTLTIHTRALENAADDIEAQVPYKLTVWDFDQPEKNRFETGYGFWMKYLFAYQSASSREDKKALWEKYLKAASDHRISFFNPTPLDEITVNFDTENLTANIDFTAFDAEMTRVMERYNITNFVVPVQGLRGGAGEETFTRKIAGFSGETPEYRQLMADYLGKLQEHLREKGWLDKGYVYWYDEPEEKDYPFVTEGFGLLKKYAPDLARMLTEEPNDRLCDQLDAAGGNIDIWCPVSNCFSMPEASRRMAKGERFWWYVCTGPKAPYCTEFTDHPAHELRLWHWQAFERGITGSLIWITNYWTCETAFPDGYQNPYTDPVCYAQFDGLAPGVKLSWGNGDGRLFYPPLCAAAPNSNDGHSNDGHSNNEHSNNGQQSIEDPVDSIRIEELREGIEDYEILLTLRERYEAKKSTLTQEERSAIEKIFDFSDITTSLTSFTDDPALILRHRARAAEAIERLGE